MEAKEAKEAMESQMELRWSSDGVQTEAKEAKIASQDRIQAIQVIQEEKPDTQKRPAITGRSLKSIAY